MAKAKKKEQPAGQNGAEGPSKMQMVREALQELGSDAKPRDIGEYVQKKYGAAINPQMISAYKSTINGGGGAGRSRAGRRGGGDGVGINLGDLEAVKGLLDRLGVAQLQNLVRVMAK